MTIVKCDKFGNLCYVKEQKSKDEILALHNKIADYEPGKMSKYNSFDDMLQHLKDSYHREYDITD